MKRYLIFSIVLVALVSCVKEPTIYLRLPEEDAAAIPYQKGQTLNFVNQDGDTLLYVVTYDETQPFSEDSWGFYYYDDSKTSIIRQPWCYARTVQLRYYSDSADDRMLFTVIPDRYLYFQDYGMSIPNYDLKGATETVEVNGITYENVHVSSYHHPYNDELDFLWYFSEEVGLIAVKNKNHSLTLIP